MIWLTTVAVAVLLAIGLYLWVRLIQKTAYLTEVSLADFRIRTRSLNVLGRELASSETWLTDFIDGRSDLSPPAGDVWVIVRGSQPDTSGIHSYGKYLVDWMDLDTATGPFHTWTAASPDDAALLIRRIHEALAVANKDGIADRLKRALATSRADDYADLSAILASIDLKA